MLKLNPNFRVERSGLVRGIQAGQRYLFFVSANYVFAVPIPYFNEKYLSQISEKLKKHVIPAKAGIHRRDVMKDEQPCVYIQVTSKMSSFNWIPAFAGMTESNRRNDGK